MAIRRRTSKSVAKRHDLNYFKKGSPIRLWQWRLALIALVAAVVWLGASSLRSASAFSAGPISNSHAVFGEKCEVCHVPVVSGTGWMPVIGNRHKIPDSACISCHTKVGPHHADLAKVAQRCSACHLEHTGTMHLVATPNQGCTQCHANLELTRGIPSVASHIESFVKGHPEFRPLRLASQEVRDATFGLKFNHADHLKAGLTGPSGASKVTLQCANCHQVEEADGRSMAHSGRMKNVDFDTSCRSCHSLRFDPAVQQEAPHSTATEALTFVREKVAAAHPGDQAAMVRAEAILFRQKCALCHTVGGAEALPRVASVELATPLIAASHQPNHFFAAALFSHTAHNAVECTECHAGALVSTSGKDLLMPSIATCQRCHDGQSRPQGPALSSGHAESGCSLCHEYHAPQVHVVSGQNPAFRIDELLPKH